MKEKYIQLERSILSCILQDPKLIETVKLDDKYFIEYKNLWKLLKSFYGCYKCLDTTLICSMVKPRYKFGMYMQDLIEIEPNPKMLDKYQDMLIQLCEEEKEEKEKINLIYDWANELIVRRITTQEFKERIDKLF